MTALGEERTRMVADPEQMFARPILPLLGARSGFGFQLSADQRRCCQLSGAVARASSVQWRSPLREQEFKEYRDHAALTLAGVQPLR